MKERRAQYELTKAQRRYKGEKKNYAQCASAIDKSIATFNSKMNGKTDFSIAELEDLGNFLGMTDFYL